MGRRAPELLSGGETEARIEGADDPAGPQLLSGRAGTLTGREQIPLGHLPAELPSSFAQRTDAGSPGRGCTVVLCRTRTSLDPRCPPALVAVPPPPTDSGPVTSVPFDAGSGDSSPRRW